MLYRSISVVFVVILGLSGLAHAEESEVDIDIDKGDLLYACGKHKSKVTVRFKPDVELRDLVSWAMGFTCKRFVYAKAIGGRSAQATLIVPGSMNVEQAWRVFLVGLESMGLTVIPRGGVLAVVESGQAKSGPLPLYLRGSPGKRAQVVRKLFRPKHVSAAELGRAMELLTSKQGSVAALPELDLVLVTDFADHIARMTALVGEVDQPRDAETLYAMTIRRVDAVELIGVLEELLGAPRTAGAPRATRRTPRQDRRAPEPGETSAAVPSKMVADPRTNTLLIVGNQAAYDRVRAVVDRLDVATPGEATGSVHLYPLSNADAEELATTLQSLLGGGAAPKQQRGNQAPPSASPTIEGDVRVAFDKPTNSLLFVASTRDYLALSQIVRRLDAPRRQVYIEAMVFEVSSKVERQLGLSVHGGKATADDGLIVGGMQSGTVSSLVPEQLSTLQGLIGGIFGKPLEGVSELVGTSVPSFGVAVHALGRTSALDILSEPHILTSDNKPAVISVGQNIPYRSQLAPITTGDTTSLTAGQSIERQKVALTLKITPHISSDDLIRFDLELAKDDVIAESLGGELGPSWTTSSLENSVVVHDQETIVIGGLMSDKLEETRTKVPFLGDLPILGHLFQSTGKVKRKANLLVVLTPHIVGDQRDARLILDRRMRERKEFMSSLETLDRIPYGTEVDYGKKRGLVSEIDQVVAEVEKEKRLRRKLEEELVAPEDGPVVTTEPEPNR